MTPTPPAPDPLIARRSHELAMSAIKEMSILSARVPGAASLAWGLPSFRTPEPIRAAVARALDEDPAAGMYALPAGLPELRAAVAREHARRTGQSVDPETRVQITAGNMEGLQTLFQAIVDPGDEVIVTDPGFVSHISQIRFCGGPPVFWAMDEGNGWALDIDALPALIGPRTKAIVLVTPSNPTGAILSRDTLRAAARIARDRGVLIVLDDPYSHFTYENEALYHNLASDPEFADHIAYLFTFSKAYAMSGWRAGYMIVPPALLAETTKIHDLTMICTPRISQIAALAALAGPRSHLDDFQAILARRRALICERLDRVPHVFQYQKPQGAYYVFPRIVAAHESSVRFAHDLLNAAHVTVTPGSAFGPSGEHHVRMAYCVGDDTINLAFDRIEAHFGV
ncbi:pyridoxal phosphate-dependent aminotransferase [Aestuariicoccus sp. MJ-SS9]|uniref:pyridoxal phosphate-dependent aminotransferase n=1 Tax=Aestuariicoccus sp. MJ-SS9 TaxID=3079855 RepID=UPI002907D852|nr:pyridoxal phosphate-dependent aminotransferase [Aestuariicoccus sp. MJ-SS9]MDU8913897.1 pyridoxal phosphate-dependent aminotransferase [Aestuariicoccus sp. MJ-SS9]